MGSQRVRHDFATKPPSTFLYIYLSICLYLIFHLCICISIYSRIYRDFPGGSVGKESSCPWKRCGFHPWVRKFPWRRKWLPTPEFLPGNSRGERSLAGYRPWGHKTVGGSNPGLPHCRKILYQLSHRGSTEIIHIGLKQLHVKKKNQMFQNLIIV